MVGLMDIAGGGSQVKYRDQSIDVPGVSIQGIVMLVKRFPEIRTIIESGDTKAEFSPDKLYDLAPQAVSAVIAAGCGYPGLVSAEDFAAKLPLETQYELLEAIMRETMPGGVGPFVEKIMNLKSFAEGFSESRASKTALETSSPKDSIS